MIWLSNKGAIVNRGLRKQQMRIFHTIRVVPQSSVVGFPAHT